MRQLVVSVDTEEEGLWGGAYKIKGNTTENLRGLDRFQASCERLQVAPTYLIDAPVLDDRQAIESLSRWQRQGVCEVGSHCHPWCNPPLPDHSPTSAETYLCNLPRETQFQKLQWLTQRIADQLGRSPTSYRAGRYGFDSTTAVILEELGYRVDSSVLPVHDYRDVGGPDFRLADRIPKRFLGDCGNLIEIPITAGFTCPGFRWRRALWMQLRRKPWSIVRAAGVADRLGFARRVKLCPEGSRFEDLRGLIDSTVAEGIETLVLMLHSSSLIAGLSPYTKTENMLEILYSCLTASIRHAIDVHHFSPKTLTEVASTFSANGPIRS